VGLKKSRSYVFLFFLAVAFVLFLKAASSEENKWKLMGKTKDKNFLEYYAPSSVNYIKPTWVSLTLKKELSEEGIEQFKQNFNASLKEAEDKAGEKLQDSPEALLNILIKRQTKEYTVEIDCVSNKIRVLPEKMAAFNFVIVDEIEPGTATENIRNEVCRKGN
jgi:hypothetical protein